LREQKEADLKHAEDLFGELDVTAGKTRGKSKHITIQNEAGDPTEAIDLTSQKVFQPTTKDQFTKMKDILVQLVTVNSKKPQYTIFMTDLAKELCKDLPSDQVKKVASALTTLSNEKMKEEKLAEKGGKKTKAKAKVTLNTAKDIKKVDTVAYDEDGLDE
jgi:translation initiation factor 3 subunit J